MERKTRSTKDRVKKALLFVFNYIRNCASKSSANPFQNKAVVAFDFIFVVIVNNLILYAGALCQLISGQLVFLKRFIKCQSNHNNIILPLHLFYSTYIPLTIYLIKYIFK